MPQKPTSSDLVTVTALVQDDDPLSSVQLEVLLNLNTSGTFYDMYDNGLFGDGEPDDGVYGIFVSPQSSQTLVHYRVHAEDDQGGVTVFPYDDEPSPTQAYFHYNGEISTSYELYHLFITPENLQILIDGASSNSVDYVDCSLVINHIAYPHIKTRFRGGALLRGIHPYAWKFRFNKDWLYNGNRTLDTVFDKDMPGQWPLPPQKACFEAFDMVGIDNLESELIRLHLNNGISDGFWAEYLGFESPNSSWLRKHNHDPNSEIYKARTYGSTPNKNSDLFRNALVTDYDYWGSYNKKTRSLEPPDHIRDLVDNLNDLPDEQLLPWLDAHMDLENCFKSWAIHIYLTLFDFTTHNCYYFLPGGWGGKWKILSYDFDNFGHLLEPLYGCCGEPSWHRNKLYERTSLNPTLKRVYLLTLRKILEDYDFSTIPNIPEIVPAQRAYLLAHPDLQLPSDAEIPVVDPQGGVFADSITATITTQPGWDAYYTLDGSDPRLSNTRQLYISPIFLTESATLKAAASEAGEPLTAGKWTGMAECSFERVSL
jgi:hypothetical protein